MPILLIKRDSHNRLTGKTKNKNKTAIQVLLLHLCYKSRKAFCPAVIHNFTEYLIFANIDGTDDSWCRKILEFLSFHTSHMISSIMLRVVFHEIPGVEVMLVHHSKHVVLCSHSSGSSLSCDNHKATCVYIRLVNLHFASRWCAVSMVHLHREQVGAWSHPHFASLSDDQSLFCKISHAKSLHFGGARVCKTVARLGVLVHPMNCALYAEAAVY